MRLRYEIVDIGELVLEPAISPNIVNLGSIYIEPEYQSLGFGTALMNAACKEADEQGIAIWLVPTAIETGRQEDLERFYLQWSFEPHGSYWIRCPKTPT